MVAQYIGNTSVAGERLIHHKYHDKQGDVPTDAALLPYTVSMENKKEKAVISKPSV
jgi:hypothetical protein